MLQPHSSRRTKLRVPRHQQPAFIVSLLLPDAMYEVGTVYEHVSGSVRVAYTRLMPAEMTPRIRARWCWRTGGPL